MLDASIANVSIPTISGDLAVSADRQRHFHHHLLCRIERGGSADFRLACQTLRQSAPARRLHAAVHVVLADPWPGADLPAVAGLACATGRCRRSNDSDLAEPAAGKLPATPARLCQRHLELLPLWDRREALQNQHTTSLVNAVPAAHDFMQHALARPECAAGVDAARAPVSNQAFMIGLNAVYWAVGGVFIALTALAWFSHPLQRGKRP
ncbi:MAG TPA: hypothetical protein VFQ88_10620, partial [Nevskiaceae bacterium]|nr:hypothetical protein [Nevskiaceae bacterium]